MELIETAPRDGTHILAWSIEYGFRETYWYFHPEGSIARKMFLNGEGPSGSWEWYEPQSHWISSWKPTHWMHLPDKPDVALPCTEPRSTVS